MADAATPAAEPATSAPPALVLHRVGFVSNTALQGSVGGALLLPTIGILVFYAGLWQYPFDPFAWAIAVVAGLFALGVVGAIAGGLFGTFAGLRVSRWYRGNPLPPMRRAIPAAILLAGLNVAGCTLAGVQLALLGGLNTDLAWWHVVLLGALCALLGVVIGGYVGFADGLSLRGTLYAMAGTIVGAMPALAAVIILRETAVRATIPRRDAMTVTLLASGAVGGLLLGHLWEMWRRGRTTAE
jgi:hypothetical protein